MAAPDTPTPDPISDPAPVAGAAPRPTVKGSPRRRLDLASVALLCVGVGSGALALPLIIGGAQHPLVIVPAAIATATGATHLFKWEAPRDDAASRSTEESHP